jgi:hypothetical protein
MMGIRPTPRTYRVLTSHLRPRLQDFHAAIQGEQDFRDVTGQGMQVYTVLQQQNVQSKLLIFPDDGHRILKPQNSLLWYHTVLEWIGEWTKK